MSAHADENWEVGEKMGDVTAKWGPKLERTTVGTEAEAKIDGHMRAMAKRWS